MRERSARPVPAPRGGGVIVVAGEALIDLVIGSSGNLEAHPGGGPFNVARTVGRLQQPVAYLGRISNDRFGVMLRERLAGDGVLLDAVVATDEPTTLAVAETGVDGGTGYRFYAHGTSTPGLTVDDAIRLLPESVAMLHVGALGLAWRPLATALDAVVQRVDDRAIVALDPTCRPWLLDQDPGAYRRRLGRLLRRTDLVKVSEEDLAWLSPHRAAVDAARALLGQGPALVLLTLGPQGAIALTRTEEITVPAPAATVKDTIGAGDAFCGAFMAWWRSRTLGREALTRLDSVTQATRFACLVAARTCERAGASPPWLWEVAG